MKIYLSGPISGLPHTLVDEHFTTAATRLRSEGHTVVNPFRRGQALARRHGSVELPWETYMIPCLQMLLHCDAVAMLPDWSQSDGATIEHMFARRSGKKIIYL